MTKTKANYYNKKKDDIINYFNKSKRIIDYKKQKASIKFNEAEFKYPIDSLGLILKNETIYDKVLLVNKIEKYNHSGKHSKIIKDLKIL